MMLVLMALCKKLTTLDHHSSLIKLEHTLSLSLSLSFVLKKISSGCISLIRKC